MDCSRQDLVLGKNNLKSKTAAIIGLGAIGTNSASMLARSGLNLILIDKDNVEESNLNSQSIYTIEDLKKPKSSQAEKYLKKINPKIKAFNINLNHSSIGIISKSDIVLDCTDNMETRFMLNDYCKEKNIPLVHSAAIKNLGTVFVVSKGPCLRCIYTNPTIVEDCSTAGILNSTASMVASIQCSEALKVLMKKPYEKCMLRINTENNEITKIKVNKTCSLCNKSMESKIIIKKCDDKGGYSVNQEPRKSIDLKKINKSFKVIVETPVVLAIKEKYEIIVHNYGELLFKDAKNIKEIEKIARKIYKNG